MAADDSASKGGEPVLDGSRQALGAREPSGGGRRVVGGSKQAQAEFDDVGFAVGYGVPGTGATKKQLGGMSLEEAKRLLSQWDKATYATRRDSVLDHARRHGFGDDVAKYMRKASQFNRRGAHRKVLDDGETVRWTRKDGEFLLERNGKIVTYGKNK